VCAACEPAAAIDVKRADVKDFIAHMADTSSFKKRQLRKLLKAAQSQPAIIEAMDRPAEKAKQWFEYRPISSTRDASGGHGFLARASPGADRASVRSRVAPEYLAAILGVETYYGRLTGSYRLLDAIPRRILSRIELEQYCCWTRDAWSQSLERERIVRCAMGAPQFMPFELPALCSRCGRGGHIDLWTNWRIVWPASATISRTLGMRASPYSAKPRGPEKAADLDGRKLACPRRGVAAHEGREFRQLPAGRGAALLMRRRHGRCPLARRLQQFLCDHPLQPQPTVRNGRV